MLPDWVPAEAWAGYVEMRKKLRKPLTDRAIELRIKDLARLRAEGQDIGAVLDQSTSNGWTDVYPVKERRAQPRQESRFTSLGKQGQVTANNLQDWLEEA